jgi:hypothetical protein
MKRDRRAFELHSVLDRVALRLAVASAVRVLARIAALEAAALWVVALVTLVVPLAIPWRAIGAALGAGLAAALPVLLWRLRPSLRTAARVVDRRQALADRLGTAVDLLARREPLAGLARLQVADALERARAVVPRAAVPLRVPRDAWIAAAAAASFVLWAQFLAGLTLPGTPAARVAAVIHEEGGRVTDLGRRVDVAGRARGLPEARRIAPHLADVGRRLSDSPISRDAAVALLGEALSRLEAARGAVDRRLTALDTAPPGARDTRTPATPPADAKRRERLEAVMREIEDLRGRLRTASPDQGRALAQGLRALSESLDRSGQVPVASRRDVAQSRRDVEQGRLSAAADALGEALRDLETTRRILEDAQILNEAERELQRSSERIARGVTSGEDAGAAGRVGEPSPQSPPTAESGTAAGVPGQDTVAPPPPGPHQGSLPGEGAGGTGGAPSPRLEGTRVPTHLVGIPGKGGADIREITGIGRSGAAHLPSRRPPADVAHEVDRAVSREPLPPAYLDLIRRYFDVLGGAP